MFSKSRKVKPLHHLVRYPYWAELCLENERQSTILLCMESNFYFQLQHEILHILHDIINIWFIGKKPQYSLSSNTLGGNCGSNISNEAYSLLHKIKLPLPLPTRKFSYFQGNVVTFEWSYLDVNFQSYVLRFVACEIRATFAQPSHRSFVKNGRLIKILILY